MTRAERIRGALVFIALQDTPSAGVSRILFPDSPDNRLAITIATAVNRVNELRAMGNSTTRAINQTADECGRSYSWLRQQYLANNPLAALSAPGSNPFTPDFQEIPLE